jgi:hypothetical protein
MVDKTLTLDDVAKSEAMTRALVPSFVGAVARTPAASDRPIERY